jgi:outer membrane protein
MRNLTFILTFLIAFCEIKAQESTLKGNQNYSFSLQQAIEHGLKNNASVINAGKDIEISKQKKWETTANGLPQINGEINYQNNFVLQSQGVSANTFNPFGSPDEVTTIALGTKHIAISQLTLRQLIFDGSYVVALQASKAYLEYFQNYKKKTDAEVREMITNSYGNVLLAEESILILEKNINILQKNYNDINQIYKNGLGEEESVEQISITLASVKSNLSNVKRLREISLKMLKINLGIDIEANLSLTDKLDEY